MTAPFCLLATCCLAPGGTLLGVAGERFTLQGQPVFLLGCSYYGGLAAEPAAVAADLDDLRRHGFNWLRLWATWSFFDHNVSAVTIDGEPREPYFTRLLDLVRAADERGLVVDVTFIHAGERAGQPTMLRDFAAHRRAVETVTRALLPYRNVHLDLANERSMQSKWASYEDLRRLRDAVKAIDPQRLLTASDTGEVDEAKVRGYLQTAGLDLIAPHAPRSAASARRNRQRTVDLLTLQRGLGLAAPVHYQEPFRRGFTRDWEPTVEDFLADLTGAREGGAAGWCFHNGDQRADPAGRPRRSFDLRPAEGRLLDQLDPVERAFLARLRESFAAAP
ncbi:MAG: hypothetical protein IT204_08880 [Fimbriimonadaceae bacterium]|nr:hypothetical protein [Fimbriimonadaceae bacterium]